MEAGGRRPLPPARGPQQMTRGVPPPSLRIRARPLQSASSRVPPEYANAESFCPRHGAQHKTAPAPVRVHSRRVIWGCQGGNWGTLEHVMHRRTQYGHPHTPTTSCPSPSSQARRGAPAPATPARRGPSQPSPQNREAPPRQLLAHLKPPPFVPAPTPGFGGVLRAWALVCPAGNDPRCCPAPLFSLEGTYFGHPSPPEPPPAPGTKLGPLAGTF